MYNIVLDTSFFISNKYFAGKRVKDLCDLVLKSKVKLYITRVVYCEVLTHLEKDYLASITKINKFDFIILDTILPNFRFDYSTKMVDVKKILEDWITDNKVTIIEYNGIDSKDVETIFNDYFASKPPFGTGNKKSEFPDAFILKMIEKHFVKSVDIYLFTNDKDFDSCHPNIHIIRGKDEEAETMDRLIKFMYDADEHISKAIKTKLGLEEHTLLHKIEEDIRENIDNQFDNPYSLSCLEINDLIDVDIKGLRFTHHFYITSLDIDEVVASIETKVNYSSKITFSYENYDYAIYDKEDNRHYGVETSDYILEEDMTIPIEIVVHFDKDENENKSGDSPYFDIYNIDFQLNEIIINDDNDIDLNLS